MQIQGLRVKSYRGWRIDEVSGPPARERLGCLERYDRLRAAGCPRGLRWEAIGWSRAKCCRWRGRHRQRGVRGLADGSRRPHRVRRRRWTLADEARVLALRDKRPLWGKRKIGAALRRDGAGFALGDSSIGRWSAGAFARRRFMPGG